MCLSYFPFWAHAAHEETWHEDTVLHILQLFLRQFASVLLCLSVGLRDHSLLSTLLIKNYVSNSLFISGRRHFPANLF